MSPLKANVLINDLPHTLIISAGKIIPSLGRNFNIRIETLGRKSPILATYKIIDMYLGYGVIRCTDFSAIATSSTLAECQAVALSDYIQRAGLELVPEESIQEV